LIPPHCGLAIAFISHIPHILSLLSSSPTSGKEVFPAQIQQDHLTAGPNMTDHEHQHETSILSWYDARKPRILDLVGDYAGKELFLVEGDSLLRACFEDDRIDFDGN
jgi:hypothetical protein